MDRRRFLRKLIQPQVPGDMFPLQTDTMPHLSKALRREPEILQFSGSDDSTTAIYTFHLEKREGNRPAGILIVSIELSTSRLTGEINLTELLPGRSPVRQCLPEAARFSVDEHHVTFYQPGLTATIRPDYSLRIARSDAE